MHQRLLLAGLLLVHAGMLAYGGYVHSFTWDEVGHFGAGLSHWEFGRFDYYAVNPPLVRLAATTPLQFLGLDVDWHNYLVSSARRFEFIVGKDLITANGERTFWLLTLCRWTCIPFSLLGAVVCFRWASDLFGGKAGVLALLLWCVSPNILAHGQLITPDVGAAALGVAAGYTFWRWLQSPTWHLAIVAGAVLGLCELTKSTWTVLFALWPLLYVLFHGPHLRQWKQLFAILLLALCVLNLGYGLEGSFTPLRDYRFLSESLGGPQSDGEVLRTARNRFADTWLGYMPVPLPKNYILGIDYVRWEFERKMASYLRGEWRFGGWHYYYLYGCLIKVPLGTWLLGMLAVGMTVWEWLRRQRSADRGTRSDATSANDEGRTTKTTWRDSLVLLAPAVIVFVLVSSQTGFNHHLRYVLPAIPFVFIWISKVGRVFETADYERRTVNRNRMWLMRGAVISALAWSVISSLSVYPHSLSYFNELVGGPKRGHWHLGNSNVDWGQDLLYVKDWYEANEEARPLHLAYDLPLVDPAIVGIEYEPVPFGPVMNRPGAPKTRNWPWGDVRVDSTLPASKRPIPDPNQLGPQPGWYVVSVNEIHRLDGRYEYFLEFEPVDWIGYSMMVFHITWDKANQVRQKLGLPLLEGV